MPDRGSARAFSTSRATSAVARPATLLRSLLEERSVLCLASRSRGGPWCAPLFYAASDRGTRLVFVTDPDSRHARELAADPRAAAAVYLETDRAREIRGVQMTGRVLALDAAGQRRARAAFLRRHPHAAGVLSARPHERFFAFAIETAKVTDNRRGFGWKLELTLRRSRRRG